MLLIEDSARGIVGNSNSKVVTGKTTRGMLARAIMIATRTQPERSALFKKE